MTKISSLNGKSVLVVDDDEDLRRAIIYDFKRRGCTIFEAACGNDALKIVEINAIDIIISDVRMPNGTGVELLQAVRKSNPDIPIVLLATGFADITEPEAVRMGAFALLEKPIDRKKMLDILEKSSERPPRAA